MTPNNKVSLLSSHRCQWFSSHLWISHTTPRPEEATIGIVCPDCHQWHPLLSTGVKLWQESFLHVENIGGVVLCVGVLECWRLYSCKSRSVNITTTLQSSPSGHQADPLLVYTSPVQSRLYTPDLTMIQCLDSSLLTLDWNYLSFSCI